MYPLPVEIEAKIFASYPDDLKNGNLHSGWNACQPGGLSASSFLEGPSFDRNGVLWCVDIVNGRLLNVSPEGAFSVAVEYDGWPNGLKIADNGSVFVADYKHGIMIHEPGTKKVEPLITHFGPERFNAINDLFFSSNGDLYFTDQGLSGLHNAYGRVFRLRVNGQLDCILDKIPSPNGLVMNLEEDTLFLAVTRANAVWRVPITSQGAVKVGNFIQLSGGVGPDGLAINSEGGLVVAHAGLGSVWVFNKYGEPVYRIRTPGGDLSTNVAFGGPENTDIFITESRSGTIYRARLELPGNKMYSHY